MKYNNWQGKDNFALHIFMLFIKNNLKYKKAPRIWAIFLTLSLVGMANRKFKMLLKQ